MRAARLPAADAAAAAAPPPRRLPRGAASAPRARAPISKPSPLIVIGGSFGLFFAITALLAFQMRAGADPAIGAGEPQQVAAATPPPPRKVLVRRVIVTRIVEHRPRRDDGGSAPAAAAAAERQLGARAGRVCAGSRSAGSGAGPGGARSAPDVHPVLMTDLTFDCMGTHARIVCADDATATACRAFLERFDAALSRFRPDSELCRLNAAQAPEVIVSPLLRLAIASGLWAAELTGGLVDPTLVPALETRRLRPQPPRAGAAAGRRARGRAAAPRGGARPCRRLAERVRRGQPDPPPARHPPGHRRHGQGPRRGPARAATRRPLGRRLRR